MSARADRYAALKAALGREWLVTSLGDWLGVVEAAGVPHVPAVEAGMVEVDGIGDATQAAKEEARPGRAAAERAEEAVRSRKGRWMARYDVGAPTTLRRQVGEGRIGTGRGSREIDLDLREDLRMAAMLAAGPRSRTPLWLRPWLIPDAIRGWPLKLRVWVVEGRVCTISNAYPQRPLEAWECPRQAVEEALGYTRRLAGAVPPGMHAAPSMEVEWESERLRTVCFTADYLVRSGRAIWLDGGSGTWKGWGADPCCLPRKAVQAPCGTGVREAWTPAG